MDDKRDRPIPSPHPLKGSKVDKGQRRDRLKIRSEILETVTRWWAAWLAGDLEAIDASACERYMEFSGNGEPEITGKTALLEWARKNNRSVQIHEWSILEPRMEYFDESAVCSYRFEATGIQDGKHFMIGGLAKDVLVKVQEGWKIVAQHGSFTTVVKPRSSNASMFDQGNRPACVSVEVNHHASTTKNKAS